MIESLLDTDLYKFTMMQVVLHHFPQANVEYRFQCRRPGIDLAAHVDTIRDAVRHWCTLRFTEEELDYIAGLRFIRPDFVEYLRSFKPDFAHIDIHPSRTTPGEIDIHVHGPWLQTILFEVPVLAIVNEVFFEATETHPDYAQGRTRLQEKIALVTKNPAMAGCKIADYGTRRRFSRQWHEEVVLTLQKDMPQHFAGTSNVLLAMRHGLTPLGTMAHEYLQACQVLAPDLRGSQIFAFDVWAREYRGDLGIALSDLYGLEVFLRDFDMYFCKLFDGARHDSGDPFEWGERLIAHYEHYRIDPRSKLLVFSDALDFNKVVALYLHFKDRIKVSFGIGTNLTNDLGSDPLPVVMKMTRCNGQPVAKLSDTPAKNMCDDPAYMVHLRQVFGIPA